MGAQITKKASLHAILLMATGTLQACQFDTGNHVSLTRQLLGQKNGKIISVINTWKTDRCCPHVSVPVLYY